MRRIFMLVSAGGVALVACQSTSGDDRGTAGDDNVANAATRLVADEAGATCHAGPACEPGKPCADLTIDAARLRASAQFEVRDFPDGDCAIVEGCVGGPGRRVLLRFDTVTPNVGNADMVLGEP